MLPAYTPDSIGACCDGVSRRTRKRRLADVAEARLEIEAAHSTDEAGLPAAPQRARGVAVPIVATAIVALLVGAAVAWLATRPETQAAPVVRLQAAFPTGRRSRSRRSVRRSRSPDGSRILYMAKPGPPRRRSCSSGRSIGVRPRQSPERSWRISVRFARRRDGRLRARWQSCDSGDTRRKPDDTLFGVRARLLRRSVTEDRAIVYARGGGAGGLVRVGQDGQISPVTEIVRAAGESRHGFPVDPAGRRRILFMIFPVGNVPPDIAVLDPKAGTRHVLVRGGASRTTCWGGVLVFSTDGALHAVRFDLTRLAIVGTPIPVLSRLITKTTQGSDYAARGTGRWSTRQAIGSDRQTRSRG